MPPSAKAPEQPSLRLHRPNEPLTLRSSRLSYASFTAHFVRPKHRRRRSARSIHCCRIVLGPFETGPELVPFPPADAIGGGHFAEQLQRSRVLAFAIGIRSYASHLNT